MKEFLDIVWNSFWKVCQLEFQNVKLTKLLLFTVIGACVIHIGCVIYVKLKRRPIQLTTEVTLILLISYVIFTAYVTVFSRIPGSQARVFDMKLLWVDRSMDQNMTNLLNVILFFPFGVLLTSLLMNRKSMMRYYMVVNYSFLTSFLIECMQYSTRRGYFEMDDLEANVLGGVLGCLSINLCARIGKLVRNHTEASE